MRLAAVAAAGSLVLFARAPAGLQRLLPPCPIHRYLHLLCPGCGGTRACVALLHGHVAQAWHHNALLLLLAPLIALYAAAATCRFWRGRRTAFPTVPAPLLYALLSAAALFTLARNLPLRIPSQTQQSPGTRPRLHCVATSVTVIRSSQPAPAC